MDEEAKSFEAKQSQTNSNQDGEFVRDVVLGARDKTAGSPSIKSRGVVAVQKSV